MKVAITGAAVWQHGNEAEYETVGYINDPVYSSGRPYSLPNLMAVPWDLEEHIEEAKAVVGQRIEWLDLHRATMHAGYTEVFHT